MSPAVRLGCYAENTTLQVQSAERLPRESKALVRFVTTFHNDDTKRVFQKSTPSLSLNSRDLLKEAIERAKTKRFQQTLILIPVWMHLLCLPDKREVQHSMVHSFGICSRVRCTANSSTSHLKKKMYVISYTARSGKLQ